MSHPYATLEDNKKCCTITSDGCLSQIALLLRQAREIADNFIKHVRFPVRVKQLQARLKSTTVLVQGVEVFCRNNVPRWSFERRTQHEQLMEEFSKISTSLTTMAKFSSNTFEHQDVVDLENLLSQIQTEVPELDSIGADSPISSTPAKEILKRTIRDREGLKHLSGTLGYYRRRFTDLCNKLLARGAQSQGRRHYTFHAEPLFARAPLYSTKYRAINLEEPVVSELPNWIDIQLIRSWLDHCDAHHIDHCTFSEEEAKIFPVRPQYLTDVHHMCLVTSTVEMRYLALSYVWGSASSFRTLKTNLESLLEVGSLSRSSNQEKLLGHRLPATIMDSMDIVRMIGEQYLWMDALCIIQDDEDGKREHIRSMGSIYANAYATIAATGGVAYYGLRGINGLIPPIPRRRSELGEKLIVQDLLEALRVDMSESPWNKRGWTFQEQIFSRRLIILGKFEASWECYCCVWFEGAEPRGDLCLDKRHTVTRNFDFEVDPDLDDIVSHVVQYNKRELTYPEDVLDAFSGILNIVAPFYPGGFCAGLPVCMFDYLLLWENNGPLHQRRARRTDAAACMPPTWSWAAWQGVLADDSRLPQNIEPLVEWAHKAGPGVAITRLPVPRERHDRFTEAARAEEILGEASLQPLSHLLYARPLRRRFPVKQIREEEVVIGFGDSFDDWGFLTPCEKLEVGENPRECELVAISMGRMFWSGEQGYHVLWIEWHQGIAYRKGVGRIPEKV